MDSIIFDLDGTLWDPLDVVTEAWNSVLAKHEEKLLSRDDIKGVMGLQHQEIGDKLFPHLSEDKHREVADQFSEVECRRLSNEGGRLYDGVEAVLAKLSEKYDLYIVSNCQEGYIESFYRYHGLDKHFLDFENAGRTGLSKGENIKLVMERNNLSNPVYVGDTTGDQQAAKAAGVPFVYAQYGFGEVDEFDHVISEFEELLDLFN